LAVISWSAALPAAEVAVGRPPGWLPLVWYAALLCWVAAGSPDIRALGVRPAWLVSATVGGALVLVVPPAIGTQGPAAPAAVEIALLDVDPPAAFVRTANGSTLLLQTGERAFGLAPSVWGLADVSETAIGAVVAPDGVRRDVDLLALRSPVDAVADSDGDEGSGEVEPVEPGAHLEVDGVQVDVLDARQAGDQTVLDLVFSTGSLTVLLPGPGQPSAQWATFAADHATIGLLSSSAVSWARLLPAQSWLLLVGESGMERARGDLGVPFLARREYGQVDVRVVGNAVSVRTERCSAGRDCSVTLPRPTSGTLAPRP
jgi:hypothetical protein